MIIHEFVFDRLPPSANSLYSNLPGKGRVKSKAYRNWLTQANVMVMHPDRSRIDMPCGAFISVVKPSRRRMDLMNREKALIDKIVSYGYLADDCLIQNFSMAWTTKIELSSEYVIPVEFKYKAYVRLVSNDCGVVKLQQGMMN